ncbi:MAG: radical SAM protein, partial [Nitrospirota bacterium]|nr:radical SAM protein [Nitrospirota bacterium]
RWERFLDLMIERDLGVYILMETRVEDIIRDEDILPRYRQAGIVHIYVGIEATDQEMLELMKKEISVDQSMQALRLLNDHGIITETSMILGFPNETPESIRRTLDLAKEYNPDFAHFLAITPWPYADMYEELEPYIVTKDYRKYNLIDPVIKPKAMSTQEIDQAIVDCYKEFYMDKFREMKLSNDPFKRDYLMTSMKLIMNNSFLKKKMGDLGTAPPEMLAAIKTIHPEVPPGSTAEECPFHNFFKKPANTIRRLFGKNRAE